MYQQFDLKTLILNSRNANTRNELVQIMIVDKNAFDNCFSFLKEKEDKLAQYAVWTFSYAAVQKPEFIAGKWKAIIDYIQDDNLHDAVRRSLMYILGNTKTPEKWHGIVIDFCFNFINNTKEKVAVKAYALSILDQLSKIYPDIIPELIVSIEVNMENALPAFLSKAKKILKKHKFTKS